MNFKLTCYLFLLQFIVINTAEYKITDQVYFDIQNEGKDMGRIIFGLFGEVAPKTCNNFKHLATKGIKGKTYAGTNFLRAIKRFMIQGGDILYNNGSGSISLYGKYFKDESFEIKHNSAGLLSTVNNGPNTNACQFLITTISTPWLDGKNVVFGKVLKGQDIVHKIEHMKTDSDDYLLRSIVISHCGAIKTIPFYESSKNYELTFWEWIKAGWFPLSFSFAILGFFHYIMLQLNKLSSFQ